MTTETDDRMSLIELDLPKTAAPAPTVRQAIPLPVAPITATENRAAEVQLAATPVAHFGSYCGCPIGTRPESVEGPNGGRKCPACNYPRRPRGAANGAPAASASSESRAVAASLGVQTSTAPDALGIAAHRVAELEAEIAKLRQDLRIAGTKATVVAGARQDATGIFTGFGGAGTMTRRELLARLTESGMPLDWAPAAKSAHAQAGRVLQGLAHGGRIVRAVRKTANVTQTWRARWEVGTAIGGGVVGGAFGRTLLVATLGTDDQLALEGDVDLGVRVRQEFEAAVAGDEYSATDVSGWLESTLIQRFRAARVGGCWYIRQSYANDAERLLTVFSRGWGRDWLLPAIPMSARDQLGEGMAKGFIAEAEAVLATYTKELAAAKKEGKSEIGSRRATTLHGELRDLAERAVGYAMMLGDRHVAQVRAKLSAAAAEISKSIDGITQRFELIFDELKYEADRSA